MAGVMSMAMLMTSVPAGAAAFTSGAETAEAAAASAEVFTTEESEDASQISNRAASVTINSATFADANFRSYVSSTLDTNHDGTLSSAEINAVKKINVSGKKIARLNGIENFTALEELNASNNSLTTVNLTKNTKLTYVNLANNKLTGTLNLSKQTGGLTTIVVNNNSLTKLSLPAAGRLGSLDYIDISHNKFTSQANAGLSNISINTLPSLSEINASYNSITSFNCSGFEGILDLSNNKLTTFTGGSEGFQANAIYLEGSGNTLSKTSKINFASLGNKVPQRFSCNPAARSKVVMVTPRISATLNSNMDQIKIAIGSTSDYATYKLDKKVGNGAITTLKSWGEGELDDPEFGDNSYTDTDLKLGQKHSYRLTVTVYVQDRDKNVVPWTVTKGVSVKTVPKAPSITVKNTASRTVTISWKAVPGATGYNVFMGRNKNNVTNHIGKYLTGTSMKRSGLQKGGTYYFRALSYVQTDGKRYPGPYSAVKSIKVK